MKHLLTLTLLCFVLITSSCVKKDSVLPNNYTTLVNLSSNSWSTTDQGKTFTAHVNVPNLTSYYNSTGAVLVYLSYSNGTYEQLPETYNGVAYSYSHFVGGIDIDIQASDGKTVITPPGSVIAKIVLIESY